MKKIILGFVLLGLSHITLGGPGHLGGKISNLTAVKPGILVMLNNGMPDNCAGSPYGWMLIKQENTAITAVVLSAWALGKTQGTIYTTGRENGTGYCLVSQFDPAG